MVGGGDWFLARDCLVGRGRAGVDWLGIIGWRFGCARGVVLVGCWHGGVFWCGRDWCVSFRHGRGARTPRMIIVHWRDCFLVIGAGAESGVFRRAIERVFFAGCWSDWWGLFSDGWLV